MNIFFLNDIAPLLIFNKNIFKELLGRVSDLIRAYKDAKFCLIKYRSTVRIDEPIKLIYIIFHKKI